MLRLQSRLTKLGGVSFENFESILGVRDGLDAENWFIFVGESHQGPFSLDEMLRKYDLGLIDASSLVWRVGMSQWQTVANTPELQKWDTTQESKQIIVPRHYLGANALQKYRAKGVRNLAVSRKIVLSRNQLIMVVAGLVLLAFVFWVNGAVRKIPESVHLSTADRRLLNSVLQLPVRSSKAETASALVMEAPGVPRFFIASNAVDGERYEVVLAGVPETLVGRVRYFKSVELRLADGWAETPAFLQEDGRPLVPGEYKLYVRSLRNARALDGRKQFEASLPWDKNPPKTFFLGALRDANYQQRLNEYRKNLISTSKAELQELSEYLNTILSLWDKRVQGSAIDETSISMIRQMNDVFASWTEDSVERDFQFDEFYRDVKAGGKTLYEIVVSRGPDERDAQELHTRLLGVRDKVKKMTEDLESGGAGTRSIKLQSKQLR